MTLVRSVSIQWFSLDFFFTACCLHLTGGGGPQSATALNARAQPPTNKDCFWTLPWRVETVTLNRNRMENQYLLLLLLLVGPGQRSNKTKFGVWGTAINVSFGVTSWRGYGGIRGVLTAGRQDISLICCEVARAGFFLLALWAAGVCVCGVKADALLSNFLLGN